MLWRLSAVIRRSFFRLAAELSRSCTTWLDAVLSPWLALVSVGKIALEKLQTDLYDKWRQSLAGLKDKRRQQEGRPAGRQAGTQAERQAGNWETKAGKQGDRGDKASARLAHYPTKENKKKSWETKGTRHPTTRRQTSWETSWETSGGTALESSWETRPREGGHTIQQREARRKTSWETRGGQAGRQAETSWEASWETIAGRQGGKGDNGRQGRGNADKPSNNRWQEEGRQAETSGETSWETGKQEARGTMRDKGRQDLGRADTPSNTKVDTLRKQKEPLTVHCSGTNGSCDISMCVSTA